MDFTDSPDEAKYRERVRAWLSANAPRKSSPRERFGRGLGDAERVRAAKAWQQRKAEAGFAGITIPVEHGGQGGAPMHEIIYRQEENTFLVPFGVFEVGLGMCIPTLLAFGSASDKARYTRPALDGREVWCQLFSEPAAGSDLAGIRTQARRDGGDWVLNGQKVWTTGAHFSDYGLILVRTDPDKPKHKGLTAFFLDMKSAGVTVRPIRQMSGEQEFNEVFFDDVRVPDAQRLGAPGDGWKVALTTLMFERLTVGVDIGLIDYETGLAAARRVMRNGQAAITDPRTRDRVADWYIDGKGLRLLNYRTLTLLSRGEVPGPEQSIVKVVIARQAQDIAYHCMDLLGEVGLLTTDDLGIAWEGVEQSWCLSAGMRIAGGTDEILKNVIAERVLGLPGDARADKDLPFSTLSAL